MKKIVRIFTPCFVLFLLAGCAASKPGSIKNCQPLVKLNSDILAGPETCVLKQFQGTSFDNTFYLSWIVQSSSSRFVFQVEVSYDGKKFTPYYMQKGSASPGTANLLFCMTDSSIVQDAVYFRLKAVPEMVSIAGRSAKDYASLYDASTIFVRKNSKTKGYSILAQNN